VAPVYPDPESRVPLTVPYLHTDPPETNTAMTYPSLISNKPTLPLFRDGNTQNLAWENIKPVPPTTEELQNQAKRKLKPRKKYARSRVPRIKYENTAENCIKEIAFNALNTQFVVKIPYKKSATFFTYDEALAFFNNNNPKPEPEKKKHRSKKQTIRQQ